VCLAAHASGEEIGDALHLCIGESGQDVSEVGAHRDLEPTAVLDHGEDRGHTRVRAVGCRCGASFLGRIVRRIRLLLLLLLLLLLIESLTGVADPRG
jgi:hypothetical protein